MKKAILFLLFLITCIYSQIPFPNLPQNYETHIEVNIPSTNNAFGNITYNSNEIYNFANNRVKFEVNSQNNTFIDYYQIDNVNFF